ncbi:MAG: DUF4153 domain-containing protein [Clostridiales bacterium]|nr:DUF4153 domain-containing protein [Clostridiales bacterium]
MKNIKKIKSTFLGFNATISRFNITILFSILIALLTGYNIGGGDLDNYAELLLSLIMGATVFMVLQISYEQLLRNTKIRPVFLGLATLAAIIYYLVVKFAISNLREEHIIRTLVLIFVLVIVFMWIPTIKSKIRFSDSFMAVFKAFFTVAFYSAVLFLGTALILAAIDLLITSVDFKAYSHVGNIIVFVYAPIHFLSLIPIYPSSLGLNRLENEDVEDGEGILAERLNKAIEASKFLDGLISYIAIPITAIYTIILLLYIITNITGDFWKDNLLEPLLVSYSIIVIVVYLLACVLKNKSATYFKKIFPKVLIPVVLFQTIASIMKIGELGITSGRYYVILFGVFATISAILFSFGSERNISLVAPILIILSLISIFPPVDAFRVSKANQISRLKNVLEENNMLSDDKIIPNGNLSEEDKQTIIKSVRYLSRMDYLEDVSWLESYGKNYNFDIIFGFSEYGTYVGSRVNVARRYTLYDKSAIDISGYDFFVKTEFYNKDSYYLDSTMWKDQAYTLVHEKENDIGDLILKDEEGNEMIRYSLSNIFDRFKVKEEQYGDMSLEDAQFTWENDKASIKIVTLSINYEEWDSGKLYQNIDAYIMVKIK